ncbi:hypothetical protein BDP81DRAFT_419366, partial [Colletotrichum phormii]
MQTALFWLVLFLSFTSALLSLFFILSIYRMFVEDGAFHDRRTRTGCLPGGFFVIVCVLCHLGSRCCIR